MIMLAALAKQAYAKIDNALQTDEFRRI